MLNASASCLPAACFDCILVAAAESIIEGLPGKAEVHAVIDPVCRMEVEPETAAASYEYHGQTYYFCHPSCTEKFSANPEKYLHPEIASNEPAHASSREVEYTCPMDPEVRQMGPGACPKCGMALEPETISEDEGPNPELTDMSRRFRGAVSLTVTVVALAMTEGVPGSTGQN